MIIMVITMNNNILSELKNSLSLIKNDEDIIKIYRYLEQFCYNASTPIEKLKVIGTGESSIAFELDNLIIKISFIDYTNHPSIKEYVSYSSSILQPYAEKDIQLSQYNAKFLISKKLMTNNITQDDVLSTYVKLRDDGYLWYDTKPENIGKDKNGNCFLLDYGELIYINDLDYYHQQEELKLHRNQKPEYDQYYNHVQNYQHQSIHM